jgi:hypothetical protein
MPVKFWVKAFKTWGKKWKPGNVNSEFALIFRLFTEKIRVFFKNEIIDLSFFLILMAFRKHFQNSHEKKSVTIFYIIYDYGKYL